MKKWILGIVFVCSMVILGLYSGSVCMADTLSPSMDVCNDLTDAYLREIAGCDLDSDKTVMPVAINIIQVVLSLMGVVAVGVILYGGFTYSTSLGDASKVQRAKNAVLYGVVGMVVASLAFAIVYFVSQSIWG